MNAETTKRLFKAIASDSHQDAMKICEKIIREEKQIGHSNLAADLQRILSYTIEKRQDSQSNTIKRSSYGNPKLQAVSNLAELPRSKRSNELLASQTPREQLRHHMILPPATEERFHSIEKEYAARERLAKFGLQHKKKILLYGAPGCGKTLGAERIAFNVGLPLVKVRFDSLISSYLGDSATNLRSIFESASLRPCVLLLDECDFIAKSRDVKNDVGEIPRIVNMLLTLLDEFEGPSLLIATTNLEKNLDSALFRRFDDVIEVPPPTANERVELLKLSLSTLKVEQRIPWKEIANRLKNCSAATCVKLAEAAAKNSILNGHNKVTKSDLLKASSEIFRG